jgi:dimethylargininase
VSRSAFTRPVPPSIDDCELTHLARERIDVARATEQHTAYEALLVELGCTVIRLAATPDLPDSVFVEDTAVVFDEVAVITRPGAASRRPETDTVAAALKDVRPLKYIHEPGTLDGGDVLRMGRMVRVGRSRRTNADGIAQLERILAAYGYEVRSVDVRGCLHLKSAATAAADATVLINPAWVDAAAFGLAERIEIDPAEPFAANALRIGDGLVYAAHFPRTHERLVARGLRVHTVAADELAKAEGGVTCCSLIVEDGATDRP